MRKTKIIMLMLFVFTITACTVFGDANKYSYEEVKEMIESNEALAVDVRTTKEYEGGHLYNAYNLPLSDIEDGEFGELKDKNAILFIYCGSGSRAKSAYSIFLDYDYVEVYNIGGIQDWPYEVYE